MIEVSVAEGEDAVAELHLNYRTGDAPRFARLVLAMDDGVASGRIPLVGPTDQEQRIEYFLTAHAPSGYQLAGVGSEGRPLELTAPAATGDPTEPDPLGGGFGTGSGDEGDVDEGGSLWWLGVLIGVVVVGAGLATYFALRPEAPEGSLGQVSLELR